MRIDTTSKKNKTNINRVVNDWNNLPEGVVKAKNLNIFKAMFDDSMKISC